jgi:hypothetical protein
MVTASPPTLADIQSAIRALKAQLDSDLQRVKNHVPAVTAVQLTDLQNRHDELETILDEASTAVAGSSDPPVEWINWVPAITLKLTQFDQIIQGILQDPASELGICQYDGGSACMTQAQCDTLPNSTWTPGCP